MLRQRKQGVKWTDRASAGGGGASLDAVGNRDSIDGAVGLFGPLRTPNGAFLGIANRQIFSLALAFLAGCMADPRQPEADGAAGHDAAPPSIDGTDGSPDDGDDWFADRTVASGLDFVHFNGMSGEFYFPEMIGAGVALLDYDGDGDLDAYFVQGRPLDGDAPRDRAAGPLPAGGRLYRNDTDDSVGRSRVPRFADVTDESGIEARGYGMGVSTGDVDNDGWVDIYLTNYGPNQLLRNNGDGTFEDVSSASGADDPGWGVSAAFVDYDRDGWLDLYVGNYVRFDVAANQRCTGLTGRQDYCTPEVYAPQTDRLYRNREDGTFEDVTTRALAGTTFGPALGVSTADFDGDGWIDIYVANDGRANLLWMNQQDGTLVDRALLSGSAVSADGRPEASMGVDAADFDHDGDEDLFMTHLPNEGNNLYVNDGSGLFEDFSASSGLGPASLGYTGFGTAWVDYDNDGWLDIFAVNGAIEAIRARLGEAFPYDERNLLFRNLRGHRFEDVSGPAGGAFERSDVSRGAAFGDIDNDGDVDVLVNNVNGRASLLLNNVGNRKHWVGLRLVGTRAPRDMLGARVGIVRHDGSTIWRRVRADGSYASANDPRLLVGLGDQADAPDVQVRWPGGQVETWRAVPVDQWTTLTEGQGLVE